MESGDLAWMLTSTALVVFMVPGLALFYGGMVRSKNVLNMLMMNVYCIGIVPIVWVLVAYSLGNSPAATVSTVRGSLPEAERRLCCRRAMALAHTHVMPNSGFARCACETPSR